MCEGIKCELIQKSSKAFLNLPACYDPEQTLKNIFLEKHTYLKYFIVQEYHDKARDVEWTERRVDNKIRVIKYTKLWNPLRGGVETEYYGWADCCWDNPYNSYCYDDPLAVLVLWVLDRLSDSYVSRIC